MVCTSFLLSKLLKLGINGRMFDFMWSFLTNCSFQVHLGSTLSRVNYPANGIPQGRILSPIVLSIVISDHPDGIRSSVVLYAEDFCLSESGSCIKQLNELCQRSLAKVVEWCDSSVFKISQSKSASLLFTKKRKCKEISLKIREADIHIQNRTQISECNLPKEWHLHLPYSISQQ